MKKKIMLIMLLLAAAVFVFAEGGGDSDGGGGGRGASGGDGFKDDPNDNYDDDAEYGYDKNNDNNEVADLAEAVSRLAEAKTALEAAKASGNKKSIAAAEKAVRVADLELAKMCGRVGEKYGVHSGNLYGGLMKAIDDNVAEAIEKAMQAAGDPVLLASGQFLVGDTDLSVRSGLQMISISRTYLSGHANGSVAYRGDSFGASWKTGLDMRIVRGTSISYENALEVQQSVVEEQQARLREIEQYAAEDSECNSILAEMRTLYDESVAELESLKREVEKARRIQSLNAYVLDGINETFVNSGNNLLIFISSNGSPVVYDYKGNGTWYARVNSGYAHEIIRSLDGRDAESEAGFVRECKNGTREYFDSWGRIRSVTDRAGNSALFSHNGSLLQKITTAEGTEIVFSYTDSRVSSIQSSAGERVTYAYTNGMLTAVTDDEGDVIRYEYDTEGYMKKIIKSDSSFIGIEYGFVNSEGVRMVSATVNEEGFRETFSYSLSDKKTTHTGHTGVQTRCTYDADGNTTRVESGGRTTDYAYNGRGLLVEKRDNASVITYSYDDRDNLLSKSYSDGSAETWQYNGFDQATRYVDRDGIVMSFSYDRYGNAVTVSQGGAGVSVMEYDGAGRIVRTLKADGTIYAYSYDSRGNCVARTASKDGGSITEYREYDSRNRLTKIITPLKETALEYFPHKMVIRDSVGLETTYTYNQRKDIVSIEERDTVTGEKRIFAYEYDKRHLPLKVTVTGGAGMMFETRYEYDAAGKKTAEIFGEWRADFAYNSAGRIASRTNTKAGAAETFTETFTYSSSSRGETVTVQKPLGITEAYDYDPWGRLFSVTDPNGNTMRRQLSGQGRILKEQTAFGGYNNFEYDSSGRVCAFGEENSATASVAYNDGGQVIRKTDREGNVTRYEYALTGISKETAPDYTRIYFYDGAGRISKIVTGESGQRYERMTEYAYSDNGRTVTVTQGGLYQSTVRRNAWGDAVSVTNGAGDTRYMSYDALGRVCVSTDAYGNRIVIAYNAIGLVKRVDYPDGSKTEYDYDHAGNLVSVVDDIGIKWQGKYDDAGRLIEERARPGIFKNYSYDGAGNVIGIRNGGETAASYNFADRGRDFSFIDGNGKTYSYVFDGFGRLTGERNRLGKSQSYEYTPEGSLSQKVDFAGRGMTIASEKTGRTRTITAGNSSVTYKFDMSGDIIEAKSESGSIFYTYDAGGRLVRQFDKGADETTTYRYDAAGRRIFMSSGDREVSYRYGKNDELLFVSDNKQRMSVSFEYDTMGREIRRVYGNGVAQATAYDKAGRVIAVSETNPFGALVRFEGYLYDSEGRQSHVIDKNGNVTFYEYDRQSRLSSALYPFGEERRNAAFAEAVEAGLHFGENAGGGENRMLDAEEYSRLTRLLRAVRAEQVPAPSVTQRCIKEMFAYDPNGNRSAKITAFGVIRYAYDAEDRLVSSGDGERGIRYDYDDTGNMIRKKSLFNTLEMRYNGFYRLEYLKMIVKTELHRADMPVTPNSGGADRQYETRYRYDALERRTITQDISGAAFRTLYDGTTFDVIKEQEIFASGAFTGLLSARDSSDDREAGRYRFIDGENEGADRTRTRRLGSGNSSGARGGYAALYANGRAVSVAMPGSNGTRSYFGTDGRGSVKSATGETGGTRSLYEYDAFGASVSGDFSQSAYLGYAGKQLDPATGFYNYGYRDYSPAEGRFTTVDPVRDGLNWFAYVHNDPVNYMDRDGLAEIFGDDIYGKPIADLPGTSIKERTTIEVMRGYSKDPNKEYNDTVKIKIDGQVVSEYTGAQSKKNWEGKTKTQTREQRFENDLTDEDYPNATLPVGDYKAMLGPGKSYTNSLSITSKTAQIPGVSTVGIKESWGFMIHSMTKASDTEARVEARSLGCTILADAKFADFRAQLEGLGLKNWDSVSMKITEETKK